jgi:hypothetical protein
VVIEYNYVKSEKQDAKIKNQKSKPRIDIEGE